MLSSERGRRILRSSTTSTVGKSVCIMTVLVIRAAEELRWPRRCRSGVAHASYRRGRTAVQPHVERCDPSVPRRHAPARAADSQGGWRATRTLRRGPHSASRPANRALGAAGPCGAQQQESDVAQRRADPGLAGPDAAQAQGGTIRASSCAASGATRSQCSRVGAWRRRAAVHPSTLIPVLLVAEPGCATCVDQRDH